MGSSLFVYGSHWAKHIANLLMARQPNRSISIIGHATAERITRVMRCKILVSALGRTMQFHVLSMDAPPHIDGRIAFPSIVNRSERFKPSKPTADISSTCENSHSGVLQRAYMIGFRLLPRAAAGLIFLLARQSSIGATSTVSGRVGHGRASYCSCKSGWALDRSTADRGACALFIAGLII